MSKMILTTEAELGELIQKSVREALNEQKNGSLTIPVKEILTLKECAAYLDLAPQTIYGYTSNRLLPFIKRGKKLFFEKSKLEKWLQDGRHKSVDELNEEYKLNATRNA
ncbi:MAG: helix-turn-helix domain-containing protein [Bacteroidetes bacterium]|nr:helix-turn-helix domain-containing protein [Bacteroidota bacterium]